MGKKNKYILLCIDNHFIYYKNERKQKILLKRKVHFIIQVQNFSR